MTGVLNDETIRARGTALFQAGEQSNYRHTDRMFAWLMAGQWVAGIVIALTISPLAWEGRVSHMHVHVWAALLLGFAISGFPMLMAVKFPGVPLTRHVIAVGQMMTSALLIHLTGGRIETHFHIFGSLAFLAFYRDWKVVATATVVVGLDHLLRGIFWPESVFGVLSASNWRWLEHVMWVAFEDIFLLVAIRRNVQVLFGLSERQARLEAVNASIEEVVETRTAELKQENVERQRAEKALISAHEEIVMSSRKAGMAEIATNVLHNVGNVLNSVNISAFLAAETVRKSKVGSLEKVAELLTEQGGDLGKFLTTDERGKHLPAFLAQLSEHLQTSQAKTLKELEGLQANVEHIKDIVTMQQDYAKVSGYREVVDIASLVEDSLSLNGEAFNRHRIKVVKEFEEVPKLNVDKHKVLQILINLVRNAKYACDDRADVDRQIKLRVVNGDGTVSIAVADNGVGIAPENFTKIFQHGFTTKKDGHGFGLHGSSLAAKEMGGELTVESAGVNQGATFTLILPIQAEVIDS